MFVGNSVKEEEEENEITSIHDVFEWNGLKVWEVFITCIVSTDLFWGLIFCTISWWMPTHVNVCACAYD